MVKWKNYMLLISKTPNYNAKKALVKGIIVGIITAFSYLIVVVVTTPSLSPIVAIDAAFRINSMIIFGLAIGVGTQIFISSYSKGLGCSIDKKKKGILGAGSGGIAISLFFSFFSLVPLGCCGSWLLILSLLPSVFGSSLSVALIQYSMSFSYAGLAIVFGFAALSAFKLQKELKHMKKRKGVQKVRENNSGFGS